MARPFSCSPLFLCLMIQYVSTFCFLLITFWGGSRGSDAGHWTRASGMCGKHHYSGDDALKMSIRYCFLADTSPPKAFVLCSYAVEGSTCHARPRVGFHIAESWGSHSVCCPCSETFNWHLSRVDLTWKTAESASLGQTWHVFQSQHCCCLLPNCCCWQLCFLCTVASSW